jgi:surface protein
LYVCGKLPYGDSGLIITVSSDICIGNVCAGPTPTPTTTPTPTPTLPAMVGYFQDTCNPSYEFTLSNIPGSFSPLSGVYYIESSGYVGCATYIGSTTSTNIFSFVAMGSQPSVNHCQISNFIYPCPTLTPTPSVTPTLTPTPTVTMTVTPTNTITPTPTTSMLYSRFRVLHCCNSDEGLKTIKFMSLPSYFLPGTAVVDNDGNCWSILSTSVITPNEFWNYSTTYMDCELCIEAQTCSPIPPPSFISVWVTTLPSESIMLPYETTGLYNGTIDWGDGNTSTNSYANRAHTYTTPGTYTITISGTLIGWSFLVNPISSSKIYEVLQWGCLRLGNSSGYFYLCGNLSLSNVSDVLNLTGTNDLSFMFASCNLTNVPHINSWDTSNITNMSGMFNGCATFDDNIGSWDVSNVTDMQQMFESNNLFNNGGSPSISNWNTQNVTNMFEMFLESSIFNQPLSGWNVSNVTNMSAMFENTTFNQDIGSWDVSNVTNFFGFMAGKTFLDYSTTNLNSIYNGWSALPTLQSGVNISFGTIKYTAGGSAGKAILQGTYGWTITDGGI